MKNCTKGYSCGKSCINKTLNCRKSLDKQTSKLCSQVAKTISSTSGFSISKPKEHFFKAAAKWLKEDTGFGISENDIFAGHDVQHAVVHELFGRNSADFRERYGQPSDKPTEPGGGEELLITAFSAYLGKRLGAFGDGGHEYELGQAKKSVKIDNKNFASAKLLEISSRHVPNEAALLDDLTTLAEAYDKSDDKSAWEFYFKEDLNINRQRAEMLRKA